MEPYVYQTVEETYYSAALALKSQQTTFDSAIRELTFRNNVTEIEATHGLVEHGELSLVDALKGTFAIHGQLSRVTAADSHERSDGAKPRTYWYTGANWHARRGINGNFATVAAALTDVYVKYEPGDEELYSRAHVDISYLGADRRFQLLELAHSFDTSVQGRDHDAPEWGSVRSDAALRVLQAGALAVALDAAEGHAALAGKATEPSQEFTARLEELRSDAAQYHDYFSTLTEQAAILVEQTAEAADRVQEQEQLATAEKGLRDLQKLVASTKTPISTRTFANSRNGATVEEEVNGLGV